MSSQLDQAEMFILHSKCLWCFEPWLHNFTGFLNLVQFATFRKNHSNWIKRFQSSVPSTCYFLFSPDIGTVSDESMRLGDEAGSESCGTWLAKFHDMGAGTASANKAGLRACRREIWIQTERFVKGPYHQRATSAPMSSFKVNCLPDNFRSDKEGAWHVSVSNQDILHLAWTLGRQGQCVAVLNMACDRTAGGGVARGAGAQEENLYRRTDICLETRRQSGWCPHYPLNHETLVTEAVTLLRGREEDGYPFLTPAVNITVISCAAVREPELDESKRYRDPKTVEHMRNAIRSILLAAKLAQCDFLLLSAFGCGAYKNPPMQVAQIFQQELARRKLGQVVFCIKEDHNSRQSWNPSGNFLPFQVLFPGTCCDSYWHGWHCFICGKRW